MNSWSSTSDVGDLTTSPIYYLRRPFITSAVACSHGAGSLHPSQTNIFTGCRGVFSVGGRAVRERARCCQSADGAGTEIEAAGDIHLRLARSEPLQRLLALVWRELARPAELHAAILGALAALAGARDDQRPLELGEPTEYCQHQPPVRRRGAGPCVPERTKAGTALADLVEHVQQVLGRPRQAIEAHDYQHVALFKPANQLGKLWSIGLGPRDLPQPAAINSASCALKSWPLVLTLA